MWISVSPYLSYEIFIFTIWLLYRMSWKTLSGFVFFADIWYLISQISDVTLHCIWYRRYQISDICVIRNLRYQIHVSAISDICKKNADCVRRSLPIERILSEGVSGKTLMKFIENIDWFLFAQEWNRRYLSYNCQANDVTLNTTDKMSSCVIWTDRKTVSANNTAHLAKLVCRIMITRFHTPSLHGSWTSNVGVKEILGSCIRQLHSWAKKS